MAWARVSPVASSTFTSSCTSAWPEPGVPGAASTDVPTTTWRRFGRPSRSRSPAPYPVTSTTMAGMWPQSTTRAARRAAPVGVVSSNGTSVPWVGAPTRSAMVAGAGTGISPCADSTMPWPVATLPDRTSSIPSSSRAAQVPTTSTMLSMAPTSWKCTSDGGRACSRPSTSARALNTARDRAATRSGRSAAAIIAPMSAAVRCMVSSFASTFALVPASPHRRVGPASRVQPSTGSRHNMSRTSSTAAPASMSAPRAISPEIPEKPLNQATRVMSQPPQLVPAGGAPHTPHRSRCRSRPRSGRRHTTPACPGGRSRLPGRRRSRRWSGPLSPVPP